MAEFPNLLRYPLLAILLLPLFPFGNALICHGLKCDCVLDAVGGTWGLRPSRNTPQSVPVGVYSVSTEQLVFAVPNHSLLLK